MSDDDGDATDEGESRESEPRKADESGPREADESDRTASDERVLASFLDGEEELRATWRVDAVHRGWATSPPQFGDDVRLGLTDRRLLWDDEELDSVALAAVEDVERDVHVHRSAPRIVRIGSAAMLLGLVTTVGVVGLGLADLTTGLLPIVVGVLAFLGAVGYARFSGQSTVDRVQPRLRIDDGGEQVTVWGEEDALDAVRDAVAES